MKRNQPTQQISKWDNTHPIKSWIHNPLDYEVFVTLQQNRSKYEKRENTQTGDDPHDDHNRKKNSGRDFPLDKVGELGELYWKLAHIMHQKDHGTNAREPKVRRS